MTNYFQQQGYNRYPMQPNGLRIVPVASDLEISNYTSDFNGMPTYFHNQATNEIVIKQFDIRTGITSVQKFIRSDGAGNDLTPAKPEMDISKYDDKLSVIDDRLEGLEKSIEDLKGGKK